MSGALRESEQRLLQQAQALGRRGSGEGGDSGGMRGPLVASAEGQGRGCCFVLTFQSSKHSQESLSAFFAKYRTAFLLPGQ